MTIVKKTHDMIMTYKSNTNRFVKHTIEMLCNILNKEIKVHESWITNMKIYTMQCDCIILIQICSWDSPSFNLHMGWSQHYPLNIK
jgi:hypothetical protein